MGLFRRTAAPDPGRMPAGALRDFVLAGTPSSQTPARELRLLAVDVETTGLDPRTDQLLSIGWVAVDGDTIVLATAGHVVLRVEAEVGRSAVFHGITDDELAGGTPPRTALEQLLEALAGRVLLAHHAAIETGFLSRALQEHLGASVPLASVDTLQIRRRMLTRGFDDEPPPGALRLWSARDQYGLPRYASHEALTDALACAELYLAEVSELGWDTPLARLR